MLRVLAHRLGQAVATAIALATLCFAAIHALPGDLSLQVAAARVGDERVTRETADRIRREERLDAPLALQYARWMAGIARGELGRSLVSGRPVAEELAYHARYTIQLGAAGWLLSYLFALPLGLLAGFQPGGWLDRAADGLAVVLASLPSFLVGIGLVTVFALGLRLLPPAGFRTGAHMVLPALTLALSLAAFSIPVVRDAVVETRAAFFLTFARMKGLCAAAAFLHHGARNAAIPVVTFAALQFALVIDGFVVIETLFNYPGLGDLLVKSLVARDVPVIMGAGLLVGLSFAMVNLAADMLCLWLDPRRRRETKP
jgi:peptide/nickel transport system permease protein